MSTLASEPPSKKAKLEVALVGKPDQPRAGKEIVESKTASALSAAGLSRTSSLSAPTLLFEGHSASITSVSFSPNGKFLASSSVDKTTLIWDFNRELKSVMELRGHSNAVLDVHFGEDEIWSCGSDGFVIVHDSETGSRVIKMAHNPGGRKTHGGRPPPGSASANCLAGVRGAKSLVVSGGNDGHVRLWDGRVSQPVWDEDHKCPALAIQASGHLVFAAGIDNAVKVYDRRRNGGELFVAGYSSDSVTGLSLSPDGTLILSTSMDATLRVLDVRSFCSGDRELVCLTGHTTGPERSLLRCAWDSEARYVTSGSDNGVVNVWDRMSAKLVYSLPGHKGPVSAVAFHPSEPVLASGGNDSKLFVGELN